MGSEMCIRDRVTLIHLQAHGLRKGDEHPAYTLGTLNLTPVGNGYAVWYMTGDTEENVVKLCQHAGLSADDRMMIMNLQKLGVPIILEVCPFHSRFFL